MFLRGSDHECELPLPVKIDKSSSEDEIANVNVLRRHRTCRGQSLRPLNGVPNFYCN